MRCQGRFTGPIVTNESLTEMKSFRWTAIWCGSIALAIIFAACGKSGTASSNAAPLTPSPAPEKGAAKFRTITASQLAEMLPAKTFTLVNVHTPDEVNIPQTDLNIRFDHIAENLAKLPSKDSPIVIYCRSGQMSRKATLTLVELGYTNLTDVAGGFLAWKAAGEATIPVP